MLGNKKEHYFNYVVIEVIKRNLSKVDDKEINWIYDKEKDCIIDKLISDISTFPTLKTFCLKKLHVDICYKINLGNFTYVDYERALSMIQILDIPVTLKDDLNFHIVNCKRHKNLCTVLKLNDVQERFYVLKPKTKFLEFLETSSNWNIENSKIIWKEKYIRIELEKIPEILIGSNYIYWYSSINNVINVDTIDNFLGKYFSLVFS